MKFLQLSILISLSIWTPIHAQAPKWKAPGEQNRNSSNASHSDWLMLFQDKQLRDLVNTVDLSTPNLAAAIQRVEQARARLSSVQSTYFPTINTTAGYNRDQFSGAVANNFPNRQANEWTVGLSASYEIDLWGRLRSNVAAARANMLADQATVDALRLGVRAEIADAYLALRGVEGEMTAVKEINRYLQIAEDLTKIRTQLGNQSELELEQVRADLATGEAEIASLAALRMEIENTIALAAGRDASSFKIASTAKLPDPPKVPTLFPHELLRRRPDVAVAERRMEAAYSAVGVAKSEWYPRLNLEAGVGVTADRVGNLDRSNAREGNIGLRITFPLIDHGKRKAKLDEAQANFRETIQLQRQQILAAQADAETALGKVHWTAKQSELTTRSATAAGKASALSMKRYEAGNMDVFQYLVLERSHLNASRSAVRARTAQLRANVALIRALGGGWTAANASTK